MNITFEELRAIKHQLPTGSISKIARSLDVDEQTVRNYFGASKFQKGDIADRHLQPGPRGGIMNLQDTTILEIARNMIKESRRQSPV